VSRQNSSQRSGKSAAPGEDLPALDAKLGERTTELESAREELDRRGAYLETIVQHIPAGLVIAEAGTREITLANDQARTILGPHLPVANSLGEPDTYPGYHLDGSALEPQDWPLARALYGEHVVAERVTVARGDASPITLEISAAPVRSSTGEIIAAVSLFQDVTEAEARRRAAAEFIANAAHELRTPLAAIVSAVDVLESGAKEHPRERDRFLAHIAREAGRLVRLTRALLLLARVQSGTEAPRVEIVELAPVLAEVAAVVRPAPGVQISVRCSYRTAALANRGLLEQALTSIADNAARYTSEGRILLSGTRPRGKARIRIRDTGHGMTPEELGRAGDRFFRGKTNAPGGIGLGLSIARQAIEAMGGTLSLQSELGAGTTVEIELPGGELVTS
jgi:two-component system phosphate regulon sensor histidine kinase PhoR